MRFICEVVLFILWLDMEIIIIKRRVSGVTSVKSLAIAGKSMLYRQAPPTPGAETPATGYLNM